MTAFDAPHVRDAKKKDEWTWAKPKVIEGARNTFKYHKVLSCPCRPCVFTRRRIGIPVIAYINGNRVSLPRSLTQRKQYSELQDEWVRQAEINEQNYFRSMKSNPRMVQKMRGWLIAA